MQEKPDERKSFTFAIRLKPVWRQRLDFLAEEQEVSRTQIMRWALKEYLQKYGPGNDSKTHV